MNIPSTTALVPIHSPILPLVQSNPVGASLDYWLRNDRNHTLITMYIDDVTDSSRYGPDGTKLVNPQKAELIDIYI